MNMGLIYKVTNLINGKIYIGLTSGQLKRRRNQHYYKTNSDTKESRSDFHNALKNFKEQDFYWEVIEDNIPVENLPTREKYWINYYNSYKNGYNMNSGGANGDNFRNWRENNSKEIVSLYARLGNQKMKEKLKQNPELEQKRKRNAKIGSIKYYNQHKEEVKQRSYETYLKHKETANKNLIEANKKRSKKILCIETGIIYESASEAARQNNLSQGNISSVCRGERKTTGKMHWKYIE